MESIEGRREFLKTGAKTAMAAAVPGTLHVLGAYGGAPGTSDRVRVAIVGLRGRGDGILSVR